MDVDRWGAGGEGEGGRKVCTVKLGQSVRLLIEQGMMGRLTPTWSCLYTCLHYRDLLILVCVHAFV